MADVLCWDSPKLNSLPKHPRKGFPRISKNCELMSIKIKENMAIRRGGKGITKCFLLNWK